MNKLMRMWPLMAEAEPAGGGEPPKTEPAKTEPTTTTAEPAKTEPEPAKTEPAKTEPPKTEPAKTEPDPAKTEPAKAEPQKEEPPKEPVNLMDDEPEEKAEGQGQGEGEAPKGPTDEERQAFVAAVRKIDIGEGVSWDDPALEAMAPSLMEMTGGDAKKADRLVKDYTAYQQKVAKAFQEQNDKFLNGLVDQCRTKFGEDLPKVVKLAKAGGLKVFGEKIWNVMKRERAFANNPDIIERLAAVGRSATDDPGVVKKETAPGGAKRDWRESMYGGHR